MLCPFCGTYAGADEIICPACGKLLPRGENTDTGVMAIRQGKRAREEAASGRPPIWLERQGTGRTYVDPEARPSSNGQIPVYADPDIYEADGAPASRTPEIERRGTAVYGETAVREAPPMGPPERRSRRVHPINRGATNWMIVLVVLLALLILGAVGAFIYLRNTDEGQRILARLDFDASSAALWEVGEEQMNTGDMDRAIANFEKAREKDGKDNVNVAGLLTLASTYESVGRTEDAEAIYVYLYTDVVPSATEAYANEIRILLATEREAEAAVLMQTAYRKTGSVTFYRQRRDLLPQQPVTDLTAGLHEIRKTMHLTSPQGYQIYYLLNSEDGVLPDDGVLYEDGIFLDEGVWALRAVCVSDGLVSDELAASYTVRLPSPQMPRASLAPATYKTRQRVRLWPGLDNVDEEGITIYYTIDGSEPNADSPIYVDDEPFRISGGYTTLKAVAVNRYGKSSNTLERLFKVEARPWPESNYSSADVGTIKLNTTTYESFSKSFGEGRDREDVELYGISDPCRRYTYDWGYATFRRSGATLYLVEIYCTTRDIAGPRSTGVGDSETDVTKKFTDYGQVESPSGNRGLYYRDSGACGRVYKQEDGTKLIRYICFTPDSHTWQLDYKLNASGTVAALYQVYIP